MQGAPFFWACIFVLQGCADAPVNSLNSAFQQSSVVVEQQLHEEIDPFIAIQEKVYPELPRRFKVERLAVLPKEVEESSGLARRHGRLWTHNDSGHDALLYELTESGDAIRRAVHPLNAVNEDWEALADDEDTLYVADCGNNIGDRIWIQIYKIAWKDLEVAQDKGVVPSKKLSVRLADTRPVKQRHAHNQDCEALTLVDEELWLFTKNWEDEKTRLYRIDKISPVQQVLTSAEFPADGLITGADYDHDSQRLALVGYRLDFLRASAFVWIVPVVDGSPNWEQGSYHSLNPVGQWEAIIWYEGDLLVTRESSILGSAQLGIIRLSK